MVQARLPSAGRVRLIFVVNPGALADDFPDSIVIKAAFK